LAGPSDDGGFEDVRELRRNAASSSATRRVNSSIRASRCTKAASRCSSAFSNRPSRSSSSTMDGESDTTERMARTGHEIKSTRAQKPAEQLPNERLESIEQLLLWAFVDTR
jgi:hypothetical protein